MIEAVIERIQDRMNKVIVRLEIEGWHIAELQDTDYGYGCLLKRGNSLLVARFKSKNYTLDGVKYEY